MLIGAKADSFRESLHALLNTLERAILHEHEKAVAVEKGLFVRRRSLEPPRIEPVSRKVSPGGFSNLTNSSQHPSSYQSASDQSAAEERDEKASNGAGPTSPDVPHPHAPTQSSIRSPPSQLDIALLDPMVPAKSDRTVGFNSTDVNRVSQSYASEASVPDSPSAHWSGQRASDGHHRYPSFAMLSCTNEGTRLGDLSEHSDYSMFQLHDAWTQQHAGLVDKVAHRDKMEVARSSNNASQRRDSYSSVLYPEESTGDESRACSHCIISPTSRLWVIWNFGYMAFLLFELIANPLQVFEGVSSGGVLQGLGLAAAVFWTLDLFFVLSVGYISTSGQIVRSRYKIVMRYAKSWLFMDLTLVMVDWIFILQEQFTETAFLRFLRVTKVVRYFRFIRALRFARLHRLPDFMHVLDDTFNSELLAVWKSLSFNIFVLLVVAHLLACTWYFIAKETRSYFGEENWVDRHSMLDTTWQNRYFTSLHWSLAQVTPGSMDVQPQNVWERIYNCIVLTLGIIIFSSIISSITSGLSALKNIHGRYDRQRFMLRRFLRERTVSAVLSHRVLQYTDNILKPMQRMVRKNEVELLTLLPKSLYMDVVLELYDAFLVVHPLFQALKLQNRLVLQKICCNALEQVLLSKADVLFSPGETALQMYFVILGKLVYARADEREITNFAANTYFCEVALWTNWVHQGDMNALMDSELLALDSGGFRQVMAQHHGEMLLLKEYGTEFVYRLNEKAGFFAANGSQHIDKEQNRVLTDAVKIDSALALALKWCNAVD
mmetsp:Transcript_26484/g.61779  ORF Transcript_26484/g.61779 Transcript_26484/m.61779 type:complete len:775 (+) Transcript_26484:120-2444(+)